MDMSSHIHTPLPPEHTCVHAYTAPKGPCPRQRERRPRQTGCELSDISFRPAEAGLCLASALRSGLPQAHPLYVGASVSSNAMWWPPEPTWGRWRGCRRQLLPHCGHYSARGDAGTWAHSGRRTARPAQPCGLTELRLSAPSWKDPRPRPPGAGAVRPGQLEEPLREEGLIVVRDV